jgi:hypothetical protein
MKLAKALILPAALLCCSVVPTMAVAQKETRRPAEPATPIGANCKQSVRPNAESAPLRRGECPKVRRILM